MNNNRYICDYIKINSIDEKNKNEIVESFFEMTLHKQKKGLINLVNELLKCKTINDEIDNNFTFTSCDDCKNKIDGTYQEICSNCKRFYECYFEAKEKL